MSGIHYAIAQRIGTDLSELIEEVRLTGEHWGKCKAKVDHLDHMRKVRLAELREGYRAVLEKAGDKVTESRLDDLARKHKDYKAIIMNRYEAAIEESEASSLHFAKRNAMDALTETMRQERAEMRLHQNA